MSDATYDTSILDSLTIGDPISQHHGVKCCPAIRESTDERYIVKILSIPASQVQLDALLLTGAYSTPAHALEYFRGLAEEVLAEVETVKRLHAMEGFLPFTHAEIRKSEEGIGYQVYLISPYKRSLERQMQTEPLTHLAAVNLGLDLCAALAICRRAGFLYVDLKPSNVFITPNQGYRISDLGFIPLNSLKYASFPEQYRSHYTAPEIADAMSSLNSRIDIYALGLILYQVYNNGELPLEAMAAGGTLPPPAYADYEIAEIILKACDPNPANRWAEPLQMGQAIVSYMQRNSVNDTPIVPPPVVIPPEPVQEEVEQPEVTQEPDVAEDAVLTEDVTEDETVNTTADATEDTVDDTDDLLDSILADIPSLAVDPKPATSSDPLVQELTEAILNSNVPDSKPQPPLDLSFMDKEAEDETVPTEESAADIKEELVTEEVQEILARADELISHELPEPAVAPEPIEVPFPEPITLPEEPEDEDAEPTVVVPVDVPVQEPASEEAPPEAEDGDLAEDAASDDFDDEDDDEEWDDMDPVSGVSQFYSDKNRYRSKHPHIVRNILIIISSIALLAALIAGGILFYQHYFLQQVDDFIIDGSVDSMTVVIDSSIDDDLLTVTWTDTYGNTRTQEVINGRVHFTNLTPNTQYRVQLNISGFHQLSGKTSGSFTTADQTEILNFAAVAGDEDGSVILSFAVNGPEPEQWTVAYSTGNSPETTQVFTGHSVTVTDLIVGNEYLFRLIPNDDQYLSGAWQLRYTAQQIVFAQELSIRSCKDGTLVAVWNVPEGLDGQSWNVRCYNNNGYDQTVTTTDCQAQFTELDHAYDYTVEVTAVGMTKTASTKVSANPITLNAITATDEDKHLLTLNWTYTGEAPAEGWILDYTVDGGTPFTVSCPEATAQITRYPGSTYEINVRPVGDITCFGQPLTHEVDAAAKFSGHGVSAKDMSFYMCLTPNKKKWDRFDVPAEDYKTSFPVGVKASFLVELWKNYKKSDSDVTITYIVRTEDGQPVSLNDVNSTWNDMWSKKFCELDIPQMPETPGNYKIEIYFNDQHVTTEAFTIT